MAAESGALEDVYATLLLSDTYLPGALVLGHSLRDAGTTKKLAVLVTLDSVSTDVITQLRTVYDHVIPVPRIRNAQPENLQLMNRTDLHSAFTKINLWKQCQFRKIVYIDSDVVAYRAPDELFDTPHPFSAAPDIGWPDLFNTGVMVLTPNMGDYYAMSAMAESGISFDGADQGLINMHFRNNYNRISFTYNVTPSAHYQYLPAYRHFQSSINMVHFIGSDKPWFQGRDANTGGTPYNEMVGRWWAVYDRHYRSSSPQPSNSTLVQSLTKGEHQFGTTGTLAYQTSSGWDAQRHPPPPYSKPEAANFPGTVYEMSKDATPFRPPERYPSPPKNMGYQVSRERFAQRPKPIFPWEEHQPLPSRVFPDDDVHEPRQDVRNMSVSTVDTWTSSGPGASIGTSVTETPSEGRRSEPSTPLTPTIHVTSSDPWTMFTRINAWDEIPEIERYVGSMQQKHRRVRSLKSPGSITVPGYGEWVDEAGGRRRVAKLTDFPSEEERPSLPVTPAPIRRPKSWGGGGPGIGYDGDDDALLPAAEGVPEQTQWVCLHGRQWSAADCLCDLTNVLRFHKDPVAQLQKLAKQHSEALLQKLSGSGGGGGGHYHDSDNLPHRALPYGSEELISPTHVPLTVTSATDTNIVSPKPVKGSGLGGVSSAPAFLVDSDVTPLALPRRPTEEVDSGLAPSPFLFTDPGPALKGGEVVPAEIPSGN